MRTQIRLFPALALCALGGAIVPAVPRGDIQQTGEVESRVVANVAAPTLVAVHPDPKPYPHEGDLYYDGHYYADGYMWWHAVGGFISSDAAVEIDINLAETYFDTCTTMSDLPSPYDDCPTAGVFESDPSRQSFGLGTFTGRSVQPSVWYRGQWDFRGGSANTLSTTVNQTWGEVSRQTTSCDRYDIWCYEQRQGGSLQRTNWTWGNSVTTQYVY